jgi:hypothetical protein
MSKHYYELDLAATEGVSILDKINSHASATGDKLICLSCGGYPIFYGKNKIKPEKPEPEKGWGL